MYIAVHSTLPQTRVQDDVQRFVSHHLRIVLRHYDETKMGIGDLACNFSVDPVVFWNQFIEGLRDKIQSACFLVDQNHDGIDTNGEREACLYIGTGVASVRVARCNASLR